jgi:hypothetical protein
MASQPLYIAVHHSYEGVLHVLGGLRLVEKEEETTSSQEACTASDAVSTTCSGVHNNCSKPDDDEWGFGSLSEGVV